MRQRDSQRAKVYRVDHKLAAECAGYPTELLLRKRFNKVVQSAWWRDRVPQGTWPVTLKLRQGEGRALGSYAGIRLPRWAWNDAILAHELAHTFIHRTQDQAWLLAGHGPAFARAYVEIFGLLAGRAGKARLLELMRAERIKIGPLSVTAPRQQRAAASVRSR